jgi:DNA repair protein RadC
MYKNGNFHVVRIGEVFRPAVEAPVAAVIVALNHPSGDPAPSPEDVADWNNPTVTRQLVQAGKLLDIELLDQCAVR